MTEMNLIQAYGSYSAEKRIEIIRNNYPDFSEIVDGIHRRALLYD